MALNVVVVFTNDTLILKTATSLFIPVFLILFLVRYNSLGIVFISFLLFYFLGDVAFLFFAKNELIEASSVFYIASYLFLLILVVPKFKLLEVDLLVGAYLLVVFVISLYFLYTIYNILNVLMPNTTEVILYGVKSLVLIVLTLVSFGVYLHTQSTQSALFLTAVVFFGLSVILNYLNLYYLNYWILELFYRILYALALYVMFKYIMVNKEEVLVKKPKLIRLKESYASDTVLS
ncbi:hypothetical protein EV196_108145 [Mariniflexile fucanivorans]|uniref:YhhN-like protein n=1 Tax=Mariniflexile fucanivorans TaxID=264023 RepID=A0A4R1RDR4_9FLAO|nr:hypothetical protein [Mariniflexile fucanivorans]TCL63949.1 hypothetical protein EV196_108145 [Mariniflexile fucanivorans]